MSSPEHKKEFQTLDRLIKFCKKHDEKHAIISNEILPILYQLPTNRLIGLKKSLWRELRRLKASKTQ